jgi:hypothetical protein
MLFDWLITGQIVPVNPAAAVRGPKHVVKTGKTAVLDAKEWRKLLDSIPTSTLRDRRDPCQVQSQCSPSLFGVHRSYWRRDCRPNHRTGRHPQ